VPRFKALTALALAAILLAGCADAPDPGPDEDPAPAPGSACPTPTTPDDGPGANAPMPLPVREGFEAEAAAANSPTPRRATDGTWTVRADPDAPEGGNVMHGQGDADPGFSALLFPAAGEPADVTVEVSFSIGCVEHPHGVGVVLHMADGGQAYQIVRYSASESSWDLFTVRAGERTKQDGARVGEGTDPEPGSWVRLRVTSQEGRIQAYDGATLVLDHALGTDDATTGQVGLFLRGVSDARFDDVAINVPELP
jgi:hypothetical protein